MEGIDAGLRELFFRYDRELPLDAFEAGEVSVEGLRWQRVQFSSTHGERVPAIVVAPDHAGGEGRRRLPALIAGHGAGGSKDEERMSDLLAAWARSGFVCISADAPLHGERGGRPFDPTAVLQRPFRGLDFIVQYVVDLMRTVDYLETRGDVDPSRLGYAGFSLSTVLGVHFVALDKRVRAASFAIGGAGLLHFLSGLLPPELRCDGEIVATLMDPMHFAPLIAPRPVIMINALGDTLLPPPLGHALFNSLLPPKEIVWFEGGHGDIPQMEIERLRSFFVEHLVTERYE